MNYSRVTNTIDNREFSSKRAGPSESRRQYDAIMANKANAVKEMKAKAEREQRLKDLEYTSHEEAKQAHRDAFDAFGMTPGIFAGLFD